MRPPLTGLERFRRDRTIGVAFFILLVVLVGVERRLAEAHFNFRTAAPSYESNGLDGDELRVRLIVLNDDKAPSLADQGRAPSAPGVSAIAPCWPSVALGRPAPRGPPRVFRA